jgi:energy-coupling factor transporter ATP-binding protein EcfA2
MASVNASGGGIVLSQLSKSYGQVHAVRSVDLVIAPGETVALLGPNGAGKTTTIDMVLGLTRPDQGTVSIFGVPPAAAVQAGWVGGMLQTGSPLDHLRVRELVTLMASYYPKPINVDEVLRLTGAAEFATQWTRNCRAARPSGSGSPPLSSATPICSYSTSRPPGSMPGGGARAAAGGRHHRRPAPCRRRGRPSLP